MAKTTVAKQVLLDTYKGLLEKNGGYIAVDAKGISNTAVTTLKMKLKENGANLYVVKNTLFRLALQETSQPIEAQTFEGQTAVVIYENDPTVVAKVLKEIQSEAEMLNARYGVVDGQFLEASRIMELADIPSREVLIGKLLGSMISPLTGFMNAATGNVKGFIRVLNQLSEKPESLQN